MPPRATATAAAADDYSAAPQARDRQGREEPEAEEEEEEEEEAAAAAEAGRLRGSSAADWQLRRLPPLCLVCSEPVEVLPGGVLGVSPPQSPPPLPSHLHPLSRLPPPSAPDARAPPGPQNCRRTRRRRRLPLKGGGWEGCDSLTGAIDGRRRGFHGGIYLQRDRAVAIKKERGAHAEGLERAASSRHLSSARCLWEHRAQPADPSPPPLPTAAEPSGHTLTGSFPGGVEAVGLSMEADTFFDPFEEENLVFLKLE